jgi:hypothetical protein
MHRFSVGDRARIVWDLNIEERLCTVLKVDRLGVDVEVIGAPVGGVKPLQRFTQRKDGRLIAAGWHWACGLPELKP